MGCPDRETGARAMEYKMNEPLRILILEDQSADAELIVHELKRAGIDPVWTRVDTETGFLRELETEPEVIISDFSMPQFDFFRAQELLKELAPEIPIILVSGTVGEEVAVEVMKKGATDYLLKDRLGRLPDAVKRAVQLREIEKQKDLAEQALRGAEVRYRNLVEQLPAVTYLDALDHSTPDRIFSTIYISPQVESLLGYPPAAFLQETGLWYRLIHPDDYEQVIELNGRFVETEQPFELEHRMLKQSGDVIWVRDRTVIVTNEQTGEKYAQGIMVDITAEKKAEDDLKQSEARYRYLFENNPQPMWVYDFEDLHFLAVNDAAVLHYGYSRDEFLGMTIREIRPAQDLEMLEDNLSKAAATQQSSGPWRHRKKNGEIMYVEILSHEIQFMGRRTRLVLSKEVTKRLAAETALQESERRFRSMIENGLENISLVDADGVLLWESPTIVQTLGYRENEFLGRSTFELIHPEDVEKITQAYQELVVKTGERRKDIFRVRHRSGSWRWIEAAATNLLNEASVGGVVINYRDITDRKLAEDQVQRQIARLTALAEIDRAIISSHDIEITLGTVVNQLVYRLSADAAVILLFDGTQNTLVHAVSSGFRTAEIKRTSLKLGEGFPGRIALTGEALHVERLKDTGDGRFVRRELVDAEDFSTYHGVPLVAKGKTLGVLEVFHRLPFEPDADWTGYLNTLVRLCAIAIDNSQLFQDINRAHRELAMAYDATIEGWSRALDLRDKETEGHSQRVTEMTVRLAGHFDLDQDDLVYLRWGALLHDIGKMGIPDGILLKSDPLTDSEWEAIKQHPVLAFELLSPIHYLRQAIDIPYCHHEKWDGTGYPRGLNGLQIPFQARIFAVADVFDALTSDRPYRAAWPEEKALDHIRAQSGIHFDPSVVETFFRMIAEADRAEDGLAEIR